VVTGGKIHVVQSSAKDKCKSLPPDGMVPIFKGQSEPTDAGRHRVLVSSTLKKIAHNFLEKRAVAVSREKHLEREEKERCTEAWVNEEVIELGGEKSLCFLSCGSNCDPYLWPPCEVGGNKRCASAGRGIKNKKLWTDKDMRGRGDSESSIRKRHGLARSKEEKFAYAAS